jgi:DNA-binding GntR family transcriptional regulator
MVESRMIETASLSEQIACMLKEQILSGDLAPGERVSIDELSARLGVSYTPVRDAIRSLEATGLVTVLPRRGVRVATLDWHAFKDIFDLRIALECLAVETAALRIPEEEIERVLSIYREAERRLKHEGDRAFMVEHDHILHELIIQHCGNARLIEIMQNLNDLSILARGTLVARRADAYEQALPEHIEIMEALRNRDMETARSALRHHLNNAFHRANNWWNGFAHPQNGDQRS